MQLRIVKNLLKGREGLLPHYPCNCFICKYYKRWSAVNPYLLSKLLVVQDLLLVLSCIHTFIKLRGIESYIVCKLTQRFLSYPTSPFTSPIVVKFIMILPVFALIVCTISSRGG